MENSSRARRSATAREWRRFDRMLGDAGQRVLDAARLATGERVLDVGCGAGGVSLQAAHRVGASGVVAGLDGDRDALRVAATRAREQNLRWIRFALLSGDPVELPERGFHAAVSRFGITRLPEPESALGRLAAALAPGGRLAFVCWRRPSENRWFWLPREVLAEALGSAAVGDDRGFGLADRAILERALARAGFTEMRVEPFDSELWVGDDADDAVEFFFETDGDVLDARLDEASFERVIEALRRAYARHESADGVRLASAGWLVSARTE